MTINHYSQAENDRIKKVCESWNHPDNLMHVQAFSSRRAAGDFINLQGWTTREAQVKMFKYPQHKWANSGGNVVAIRFGDKDSMGGYKFLFDNGEITFPFCHGQPK